MAMVKNGKVFYNCNHWWLKGLFTLKLILKMAGTLYGYKLDRFTNKK